jgi:hypothetical protein
MLHVGIKKISGSHAPAWYPSLGAYAPCYTGSRWHTPMRLWTLARGNDKKI